MNKKLGFIALFSSAFIYATFGILIRYASLSFGPFSQVILRGLIGAIAIFIWILFKKINLTIPKQVDRKRLFIYLLTAPFSIACATISMSLIKVANTTFYIYAGVFISSLIFGKVLYQEKLTQIKVVCFVLSFMGLLLLSYPLEKNTIIGATLGFIPGVLDSLENAMIKYLSKFEKTTLLFYSKTTQTIVGLGLFLIFRESLPITVQNSSIFAIIGLGLGMLTIGILYFYGFHNFELQLGNIVTSAELPIILVLTAIFLKEYPNLYELIGGGLIFLSIIIINLSLNKKAALRIGGLPSL